MSNGDKNITRTHSGRYPTSRRRVLALAAGTTVGLAGCMGSNEDGGDEGNPTLTRVAGSTLPDEFNWNPLDDSYPSRMADFANDRVMIPYNNGEVATPALESWDWDRENQVLTKTLRDDLVFWNGDQYTAEDLYTWDELNRMMSPDGSNYEAIELVDDLTIEYLYKEPKNPALIATTDLGGISGNLDTLNAATWKPFLEQLQDASTDEERDAVSAEVLDTVIDIDQYMEEGLGTGSFEIVDWSTQSVTFEPVDHHRWSDDVQIERYEELIAQSTAEDELITNQKVDFGTVALEPQYSEVLPDHYRNISQYTSKFMYSLVMNWNHNEALQDRAVRRAMAAVINTQNVVTNFENGFPIEVHTGIDRDWNETYIGDDVGNFIDYAPQSSDYDLADEFLTEGGYTREDGTIYTPDDEEIEPIRMPIGTDYFFNVPGQTVHGQLADYGFPVEFEGQENTQVTERFNEKMNWGLTVYSHYASDYQHPVGYFRYNHSFGLRIVSQALLGGAGPADDAVEGWLDEGRTHSPYNGKPLVWEIPTEIGQRDLSGDTEEINLYETIREIEVTDDVEWTNEQIKKLCWMWNFHMPEIDLLYRESGHWANTQDFDWPIDDERLETDNGPYPLIKNGTVGYN
ncbi:ABC transporter substrate-binding protein [Halalkalicoccus sp. GCM10025322]|uniref:ABC transporter substrate-binding protein n=2 Tax=Halococcaceae TaxID=1963270 RepID=UPI002F965F2E